MEPASRGNNEPPTPGSALGYVPFNAEVLPSPAPPYSDYHGLATPSVEEGIYLSANEVEALQQWAVDRETLCEQLRLAEERAAAREEEVAALQARLAKADASARSPKEEVADAAAAAPAARRPLRPVPLAVAPRRTAVEANAIATQRCNENLSKREAENEKLLEQWRELRSARAAAAAAAAAART